MLTNHSTKIEDLEIEKAKLEAKIAQISKDFNIVIADKDSLAQKIKLFQTKCKTLEDSLTKQEEASGETIKKLRRDLLMSHEKHAN